MLLLLPAIGCVKESPIEPPEQNSNEIVVVDPSPSTDPVVTDPDPAAPIDPTDPACVAPTEPTVTADLAVDEADPRAVELLQNNSRITAAACRQACVAAGLPPSQCRAACQALSGATCCGLRAAWGHALRHGQKKIAEGLLAACMALCGPNYCV
jgi:hypothetical protein